MSSLNVLPSGVFWHPARCCLGGSLSLQSGDVVNHCHSPWCNNVLRSLHASPSHHLIMHIAYMFMPIKKNIIQSVYAKYLRESLGTNPCQIQIYVIRTTSLDAASQSWGQVQYYGKEQSKEWCLPRYGASQKLNMFNSCFHDFPSYVAALMTLPTFHCQ